jgi:hypothetical protein
VLALVVASSLVLTIRLRLVLVAVLVLDLLRAVGDEVSWLATLEACPRVPPRVHPVLVHPLEPPGGPEPRSWYAIFGS